MRGSLLAVGVLTMGIMINACKNDETQAGSTTPIGPLLNASASAVTVGSGTSQNVTITGGMHPYATQTGNPGLVTASFVNANADTALLTITGAVSVATGSTAIVVRDASTPQKSVTISVLKTQ